jgi:hypothetical protein
MIFAFLFKATRLRNSRRCVASRLLLQVRNCVRQGNHLACTSWVGIAANDEPQGVLTGL